MNTSSLIYPELIDLLDEYPDSALATVINTVGSTPQKAGNSALIGANGLLSGTVGGGMTELKVVQQSQLLTESKKSGLFSFELHGEIATGSESICGGNMTILIDANPLLQLPVFRQIKSNLELHIPGVLVTWLNKSEKEKTGISRCWFTKDNEHFIPAEWGKTVVTEVLRMLKNPHPCCQVIEMKDQESGLDDLVFLECLLPKPTLIISGAGHIGQSLTLLGKFLGFEVIVWDDRPEYANQTKIPEADVVLSGTVEESLGQIVILDDSFLVIVTKGHKSDAEILRKFIGSKAAYIGMIGSKAKVKQMKDSFLENRWATPDEWSRIYTPVGLDIGAKTVEEISVSIAAQLVKVRNQIAVSHG